MRFWRPNAAKPIALPARDHVDVEVEHSLGSDFPIGLNNVKPLRSQGVLPHTRESQRYARKLCSRVVIETPYVVDVPPRHDEGVSKCRGLLREEGDRLLVSVDLARIGIAPWTIAQKGQSASFVGTIDPGSQVLLDARVDRLTVQSLGRIQGDVVADRAATLEAHSSKRILSGRVGLTVPIGKTMDADTDKRLAVVPSVGNLVLDPRPACGFPSN